LRQRIAEQLHLPPSQLGDVRLGETRIDPSLHPSWDGAVIAYLNKPDPINGGGSLADIDSESMLGSLVVMHPVSEANFRSQVKLMVIPILRSARPAWEYYICNWIWQAFVSTHRTGSVLSLNFFRAHTNYPLWWHGCVWAALGTMAIVLSALPLIWRPMLRLYDAIDNMIEKKRLQKIDSASPGRGPTLLDKVSSFQEKSCVSLACCPGLGIHLSLPLESSVSLACCPGLGIQLSLPPRQLSPV